MKHLIELRIDALQRLRDELMVQSRVVSKAYLDGTMTLTNIVYLLNQIQKNISTIDEIFIETDYSQSISDSRL